MSDIADRAQALTEMNDAHALQRQKENATASRRALIIDGNHCCIDCHDPINPKRLDAVPDACRCADCQDDYEFIIKKRGVIGA